MTKSSFVVEVTFKEILKTLDSLKVIFVKNFCQFLILRGRLNPMVCINKVCINKYTKLNYVKRLHRLELFEASGMEL